MTFSIREQVPSKYNERASPAAALWKAIAQRLILNRNYSTSYNQEYRGFMGYDLYYDGVLRNKYRRPFTNKLQRIVSGKNNNSITGNADV